MARSSFFINGKETDSPLVVALPGIVADNEATRIDSILKELSERYHVNGIRLNYVKTEEKNGSISYKFNMDEVVRDLEDVIKMAVIELQISPDRVGLISNSISAFPATKFLIRNQKPSPKIRCYTSISPLLGWGYFANKEIRQYIEREKIDFPIGNNEEGKQKVIPKEMLPEIMKMDGLADLRGYHPDGMSVMTILGLRDHKADPESIRKYHFMLGGREEDLVCLDADHDVPDSNNYIIEFMAKHLAGQK